MCCKGAFISEADLGSPGTGFKSSFDGSDDTLDNRFLKLLADAGRGAGSPGLRDEVDLSFKGLGGLGPPSFLFTVEACRGMRDM